MPDCIENFVDSHSNSGDNVSNPPGDRISGLTPARKGGLSLLIALLPWTLPLERVIAYVDGYNLYYGLRSKGWKRFYWLNVAALARNLLKPNQTLVQTKYFTTIVKRPDDRRRRQAVFVEALQTLPDFRIYYGQFLEDTVTCRQCGHNYTTYHEKMTDVNISVEFMSDAYQDRFDVAFLISADSDLVGPVDTIRHLFADKRTIVAFPPDRTSFALQKAANAALHIGHNELSKSMFPPIVLKPNGVALHRPSEWH